MASSPIVTVNLWFDGPVTEGRFVGLVDGPMHWVFDKSAIFGEQAGHLSVVASGADDIARLGNAEITATRRGADSTRGLPLARSRRLLRSVVVREHRATFSLAPGGPPRPETRTPLKGFFLAGDWTDTGLPGTIEGAVLSGHRAAEAVLAALTLVVPRSHVPVRSGGVTSQASCRNGEPEPNGERERERRHNHPVSFVVVHYGELALKGRNRPWFINLLVRSIRQALRGLHVVSVRPLIGRILVTLSSENDWPEVRDRLRAIPGIGNFARGYETRADLDHLGDEILARLEPRDGAELPDLGPPRGQAVSDSVARDRARHRQARSGSARAGRSTSRIPRS